MEISRRTLLVAGVGGTAALGAASVLGGASLAESVLARLVGRERTDAFIPDAPEGRVVLEEVYSPARGQDVGLFTAVPAGHGTGRGLPVCLVLHGASSDTADFQPFGLPRFLSASAVRNGWPFVLFGVDGGVSNWEPDGSDDPQRMLLEEVPGWVDERGFDADRVAAWGWSMGGYGALRLAQLRPEPLRAVAAFSPAVTEGDAVSADAAALAGTPVGLWCGLDDPLLPAVEALARALDPPPVVASFLAGGHTRVFWNEHTLTAFRFLAARLAG